MGELGRFRSIKFPPHFRLAHLALLAGTLGTLNSQPISIAWLRDIILPFVRNVCDYIGIVMKNATKPGTRE